MPMLQDCMIGQSKMNLNQEQILEIACNFVDQIKSDYERWDILTWGLSFTTYEEELEIVYGEENLQNIFNMIYKLLS